MDKTEKATKHLPLLRGFTTRAVTIGEAMLAQPLALNYETDHFGVMCLFFASKEVNGMKSVNLLVDAGHANDASLIARSMLETMAGLTWAAQSPDERALLWRSHSLVDQYYRMTAAETTGKPVNATQKQELFERLDREATQFLTPKARSAQQRGQPLPGGPYRRDWTGKKVYELFNDVKAKDLYQQIYSPASEWSHAGAGSFVDAIIVEHGTIRFHQGSVNMAATCFASGFQALLESLAITHSRFPLGHAAALQALKQEYVTALADNNP